MIFAKPEKYTDLSGGRGKNLFVVTKNESTLALPPFMKDLKAAGGLIKSLRLLKDMTLEELAERSGVSRNSIIGFEKGKNTTLSTFFKLLEVLDYEMFIKPTEEKNKK